MLDHLIHWLSSSLWIHCSIVNNYNYKQCALAFKLAKRQTLSLAQFFIPVAINLRSENFQFLMIWGPLSHHMASLRSDGGASSEVSEWGHLAQLRTKLSFQLCLSTTVVSEGGWCCQWKFWCRAVSSHQVCLKNVDEEFVSNVKHLHGTWDRLVYSLRLHSDPSSEGAPQKIWYKTLP